MVFKNFMVPETNPQILNSGRVQANKNILEEDNRVGNIQEFMLSASFPLSCGSQLFLLMKI